MLYLNEKNIKELVDYNELISVIENALKVYESKDFVMPDRISVLKGNETYLYMPCFTDEVKGTKILTLYPDNPKNNTPVIQGIMILNNLNTGKVECMLDGAAITAYRTGAVGATGIKYTTDETCKTLGIVGTGVQGFYQCLYATRIRDIKKINIYDISRERLEKFKEQLLLELPDMDINISNNVEDLVRDSEIIVTVTPANSPVIPDDKELLRGKHFIGIGSYKPEMREYPQSLFEMLNEVYIDVDFAKEETGDLITPIKENWICEDNIKTMGSVITLDNIDKTETTLYKSVGMALFDVCVADYIYKKAVKNNVGQVIVE